MNAQELAAIRERARHDYHVAHSNDVRDLLVEVERLRAGIESIATTTHATEGAWWVSDLCHTLLNPTEGETNE